jgi:hypothetical protein
MLRVRALSGTEGPRSRGRVPSFCLDHVRSYNKSYNYFAGMSDTDVLTWQRHAVTGHRPTWPLGQNCASHNGRHHDTDAGAGQRAGEKRVHDPFDVLGGGPDRNGSARGPARTLRPVRNSDLKSLHSLGLDETATSDQVKTRYKTLVKRLHPDANGGSRANEDKLREIIQAYGRLRETGFC